MPVDMLVATELIESAAPNVALVVDVPLNALTRLVVVVSCKNVVPHTSQSPAVRERLVILATVPVESDMAEPEPTTDSVYSPNAPAFALLFVVVPVMPAVWLGIIAPVDTVSAPVEIVAVCAVNVVPLNVRFADDVSAVPVA